MATEATTCSLCQTEKQDLLMLWPCTHTFCRVCLRGWESKHSLRLPNDSTCIVCPQCSQLALLQGSLDRFPRSTSLCNAAERPPPPTNSPMLCRDEVRARLREARCRLEQRQEAVFDSLAIVKRRVPEVRQEGEDKKEEVRAFIASIQEELIKRQHYLYEQVDEAVERAVNYCHQRSDQLAENTSLLANIAEGLSDLMNRTYKDGESSCELELADFLSGVEQVCSTAVTTPDERIPLDTPKSFRLPPINVSVLVDSAVFDSVSKTPPSPKHRRPSSPPGKTDSSAARCTRSKHGRLRSKDVQQRNVSESASQPSMPSMPRSWRGKSVSRAERKKDVSASSKRSEPKDRPGSAPLNGDALTLLSQVTQADCEPARSSSMQVLCSASDHYYSSSSSYNSPASDTCKEGDAVGTGDVQVKPAPSKPARDRRLASPQCRHRHRGQTLFSSGTPLKKQQQQQQQSRGCRALSSPDASGDQTAWRVSNFQRLPGYVHSPADRRIRSQQNVLVETKGFSRAPCPLQEMQQLFPTLDNAKTQPPPPPLQIHGHPFNHSLNSNSDSITMQRNCRFRCGSLPPTIMKSPSVSSLTLARKTDVEGNWGGNAACAAEHCDRKQEIIMGRNSNRFADKNWSSNSPADSRNYSPVEVCAEDDVPAADSSPVPSVLSSDAKPASSQFQVASNDMTISPAKREASEVLSEPKEYPQPWPSTNDAPPTYIVLTSKLPPDSLPGRPTLYKRPEKTSSIWDQTMTKPRRFGEGPNEAASLSGVSSTSDVYALDRERREGANRRKQLSVDDVYLLSTSSHDSLPRGLWTCKSTPIGVGESLTKQDVKNRLNIELKVSLSERGPLIRVSWRKYKGADQYRVSSHDLDLAELDTNGEWHILSGGSYLHEIFTTETTALLVHGKFDHYYSISVTAIRQGGAFLVSSYPELVRTPRRVRLEHVLFDPQTCHPALSVDSSRRGLVYRGSPFSFFQEERNVTPLKVLPGSLSFYTYPSNSQGLDLVYWECRIAFKVIVVEDLHETLCNVGICQTNSVDRENNLSQNRRSLCCVFLQEGLQVVLQFWDGWRPAVGLSESRLPALQVEEQRETTRGLGFFLAFSKRAFVVVDLDRDAILHQFKLPKRQVRWSLVSSLHNQKKVAASITWMRPLTLPSCLLTLAC